MKNTIVTLIVIISQTFVLAYNSDKEIPKDYASKINAVQLFNSLNEKNEQMPDYTVFELAVRGYNKLKKDSAGIKKDILTLIDFSLSSNKKRLWVIDLENEKVLYNDLVAHGKNTGNEYARVFSNTPATNMSSLGFYITGETYFGKHGLSLFLDGQENGYNDNARKRAIVMHGATYVSNAFIKKYGRLGRSFGCPSISMTIYEELIKTIANGTCMFIYYPDQDYLDNSSMLLEGII